MKKVVDPHSKLPQNLIIGFSGFAGSGKDTAGKILCDKHGFKRVSFADKLKEETANAFALSLNYFHDVNLKDTALLDMPIEDNSYTRLALGNEIVNKNKFYTPRLLCIYYAACLRGQDKDVWIKKVDRSLGDNPGRIIITDVRYLNEADWIKRKYGYVLRIINEKTEQRILQHESETQLAEHTFDGSISNNGTLDELAYKLNIMLTLIAGRY